MTLFDIDTGLSNIYKSLVDGGHFAALFGLQQIKFLITAIAANTIMKVINIPCPSPKVPGLFNLSDENVLKNSFVKSGFRVSVERVSVTFEFDSAETYTSCILETSASLHVR